MNTIRSICVYCGSSPGRDNIYVEAGRALGNAIGSAGMRLVYGGGTKGIMGAVAAGSIEAQGKVTGIIPRFLIRKEAGDIDPDRFDELVITDNMHQRKHTMFEKSDAFVAMPGGIGTLEEIVEIMTWAQLGRHRKPIVFANIEGFWSPMLALLDHMKAEGFLHSADKAQPLVAGRVEDILPTIIDAARASARGDEAIIDRL
ncbi:MAG: TIGR00730 family Rossman fold protein [Rhizobiaceae bacterium]